MNDEDYTMVRVILETIAIHNSGRPSLVDEVVESVLLNESNLMEDGSKLNGEANTRRVIETLIGLELMYASVVYYLVRVLSSISRILPVLGL